MPRVAAIALTTTVALLASGCSDPAPPQVQQTPSGPLLPLPITEPIMRVRLDRIDGSADPLLLGATSQPLTLSGAGEASHWDGPIEVSRGADGWIIGGRGGPLSSQAILADQIEVIATTPITLPGDKGEQDSVYGGSMRLVADDDEHGAAFLLLNVVSMEQYLPGVLQAELFNGWPAATFEAQAVAARSFAAMQAHHRAGKHWDVTNTPATQAYMGLATDPVARQAVLDTHGQVLAFGDNLVPGYFSSCCGGLPSAGTDAVGPNPVNAQPPLAGHAGPMQCSEAPVYSWTRSVSAEAVFKALQAWGRHTGSATVQELSGVQGIEPVDHNDHGRPRRLRVVDRGGHEVQLACVDMTTVLMDLPKGPLMSGWFAARRVGDRLELDGRGFGHGAGLCQYGAAEMGRQGASASAILEFYYPGAHVQRVWNNAGQGNLVSFQ